MRARRPCRLFLELLESRIALNSYFVSPTGNDSNPGTSASPFLTLQHGASVLNPGDVLTVRAGTYAGFISGYDTSGTYGIISGTQAAPITIQADPSAASGSVIINHRENKTPNGIDFEPGCSYITINGFTITNDGSISNEGIKAAGGTNITITNFNVTGVGKTGIFTSFEDHAVVSNNVSTNNGEHGIYMSNSPNYALVSNNTCSGNASAGIQFNADISQGPPGVATNNVIEDNILFNNGAAGAAGINLDGFQNGIVENNLIYNEHSTGIVLYDGDAAQGCINNVIANNTVLVASGGRWCVNINTGSTGNTLFNNILYNAGGNGTITIDSSSLPGTVSDYNVVVDLFQNSGTNETLSQWQSATGQDKHSIISTPSALFVNAGSNNYQLSATSPAVDAGVSSLAGHNAPTVDIVGTSRPQGNGWDIGAYELIQTPPGVPTHFSISAPSSATAGSPFSITVTALDAFNNTAPLYTGTIHFTSTDGAALLPADYTFTGLDAGVHTFSNGVTLKTAGSKSVKATDTVSSSISGSASVTVNSSAVTHYQVTGFASPTTAGVAHNFTVTALDQFNNTVTSYLGTVKFTSSDGQATLPANYTFVSGDAGVHSFSATLKTAATQSLTATDTVTASITGIQSSITVNPATASHFQVSGFPSATTAGIAHNFTVTALDAFGNTATGYTGTVKFTSTDTLATLPANFTFAAANGGVHTFSATLVTAGANSITATDTVTSTITGTESGISVAPAAIAVLKVSGPTSVTAGNAFTITVRAVDSFNNTITNYAATIHFTSSDGSASLPANYTFGAADAGVHIFTNAVTLLASGTQSVTATDTVAPTITGHATIQVNATFAGLFGRVSSTGQWWVAGSNGSSAFTNRLVATWNPNVTWVDVQTGDFNGDGKTDIIGRVLQTGQWWVAINNGSTFTTTLWATWNPAVTWVDVKVGDFTGNGKADIVGRWLQAGVWYVGVSTGSSFTTTQWATWSPTVTWVDVNVGDFNGDRKADLTGRALQTGQWWTAISTGSSFNTSLWASWSPAATWVDTQVGDFTGNGKADIASRYSQTGQWWVAISTGSSFSMSLWATWSPAVTWVDVQVGDFTGDGKSDIIGRVLQTGQWWTGISTGSGFTTSLWATWSPAVTWVDVQVGDFTGDGRDDITGRVLETGQIWTGLSNGSTAFNTSLWSSWSPAVNWVDVHVADQTT